MIIHHPIVWKIAGLGLLTFEDIPKEVIKQLIPHLIDRSSNPRLSNLGNLILNDIFLLTIQLFFLLKLERLVLFHTGFPLAIDLLKLGGIVNLFTEGE